MVYARNRNAWSPTLNERARHAARRRGRTTDAVALQREADRCSRKMKRSAPNSARMTDLVNTFPQVSERASNVSNRVSAQIDRD